VSSPLKGSLPSNQPQKPKKKQKSTSTVPALFPALFSSVILCWCGVLSLLLVYSIICVYIFFNYNSVGLSCYENGSSDNTINRVIFTNFIYLFLIAVVVSTQVTSPKKVVTISQHYFSSVVSHWFGVLLCQTMALVTCIGHYAGSKNM